METGNGTGAARIRRIAAMITTTALLICGCALTRTGATVPFMLAIALALAGVTVLTVAKASSRRQRKQQVNGAVRGYRFIG